MSDNNDAATSTSTTEEARLATGGLVDSWLLMLQTEKHLRRLSEATSSRDEVIARIDHLIDSVRAARTSGADRHVTCPNPMTIGGGYKCRCDPSCDAPLRALISDLGELEALGLLYGATS